MRTVGRCSRRPRRPPAGGSPTRRGSRRYSCPSDDPCLFDPRARSSMLRTYTESPDEFRELTPLLALRIVDVLKHCHFFIMKQQIRLYEGSALGRGCRARLLASSSRERTFPMVHPLVATRRASTNS